MQLRGALEEHFGNCGEITRIAVATDYETGATKGYFFSQSFVSF